MGFLNDLLPLTTEQEITDIEYLPSEMPPKHMYRMRNWPDMRSFGILSALKRCSIIAQSTEDWRQVKRKRNIATNLKTKGVSFEVISQSTGLSLEEIATL